MISDGYETNGNQLKMKHYRVEKVKKRSSKKVNFSRRIPIISRIEAVSASLLGIYSPEMKTHVIRKACTRMLTWSYS